MKTSQLYIISEYLDGPVKIGRSSNTRSRLQCLQTGNPRPLNISAIYTLEAGIVVLAEQYLHEELREHSLEGEWFDLSPEFMKKYMPDFLLSYGFEVIE